MAAARPLTLDETNIALTLALGKQPFTSEATLGRALWPTDNFRSIITNLCGLFISVHDSKLSFIHQTAREFLMHKERQGTWQGRLNLSRAHSLLSRSCLQYLLLLDINSAAKNEDHPFLSYAASNWAFHFRSQDTEPSEKDGKDARQLCRVSGPRAQLWCQFLEREDWNLQRENWASWSDLTFASYLGLATITNDILTNEQIDVNAKGGHYRTAIYAAVSRGYLNVIRVLLEPSHKVKITEEVVKAAAENQYNGKEIMALLLDQRGTEVRITEEVVKAAARNNNREMMALLLDQRGTEFRITEEVVKMIAGTFDKEMMALLLDQRGTEVKITEEVVKAAARNNNREMMALLLDRRGTEFRITEEVVKMIAGTFDKEMMALLLDQRGTEVKIT
ncbi:hypothetical protein QBC37DRAFT_182281, partial [Rhypophila decipiens]